MIDVGALYREYDRPIRGYIANHMLDADDAVIQDIAADVWERAVRAAPRYQDRGRPHGAWLRRIALNRVIDYYRHRGAIKIGYLDETRPPYIRDIGTDGHLERIAVAAAIETLTPRQRAVIVGRFYEGREHKQMGHVATLNGSKKLQDRALVNLRRALEAA